MVVFLVCNIAILYTHRKKVLEREVIGLHPVLLLALLDLPFLASLSHNH